MSSSTNPSNGWVYDYRNQKYVRYDQPRRRWVDERGRESQPPQATPATAQPPPAQSASGVSGATGSKTGRSGSTVTGAGAAASAGVPGASSAGITSIENSIRQLSLAPSSTKPVSAFRESAFDKNTGLETLWDISETHQYQDSSTSKSIRSLNVKRIRQQKDARSVTGWYPSKNPGRDYAPGRVIEVALVPPNTTTSGLSQITPTPYPSPGPEFPQGKGTRYRRFVIFRQKQDSFEALAIKTYNGYGVAVPGVIKSHHAIIHTLLPPPHPLAEELPTRRSDGYAEGAMQATPIRVEQFDRATALDPKARLDYMDTYEFDYGVTNIRVWGRIHPDSEATFYSQFSNVWRMVMGPGAGPGPGGNYVAGANRDTSDTASQARTVRPNQPSAGGPSVQRTVQSGATNTRTARRGTNTSSTAPSVAPSGNISEQEVANAVRRFQDYARANGLTVPGQTLTRDQIRTLATNAQARTTFFQRIRDTWQREMEDDDDDDDDD